MLRASDLIWFHSDLSSSRSSFVCPPRGLLRAAILNEGAPWCIPSSCFQAFAHDLGTTWEVERDCASIRTLEELGPRREERK